MKFDDLDRKMRVFETAHDHCALPGLFLVVRLDGRGFTRLTKGEFRPWSRDAADGREPPRKFAAPFDERFRDAMLETLEHLVGGAGFPVLYGYQQSDEISLLLGPSADLFQRKLRKLESVLAGEASAALSLRLGTHAVFDGRVSQLPSLALVLDYFRWRQADAARNALSAHVYWALRKEGRSPTQATAQSSGLATSAKHELLFARGVNFADLPLWQKRGTAVYWETYEKRGRNPKSGAEAVALRRRLVRRLDLPLNDGYGLFLRDLIEAALRDPVRERAVAGVDPGRVDEEVNSE